MLSPNCDVTSWPAGALALGEGTQLLLAGVVGSHAYGLAHAASDVDYLGVHLAPAADLFGLRSTEATKRTYTSHYPDAACHELGKFVRLALTANPTVCELLWLDSHLVVSAAGAHLLDLREAFWSAHAVRSSYLGYAAGQLRFLNRPHVSAAAREKAGRHALRLVRCARQVLATGTLNLDTSGYADELVAAGRLAAADPDRFADALDTEMAAVDNARTRLPEQPNTAAVEEFLISTRRDAYGC